MRVLLRAIAILFLAGVGVGWIVTAPGRGDPDRFAALTPDAVAGEQVFWAAGCASCHAAPGAEGDDKKRLAGGQKFPSDFGTFIAPNISPHPEVGIGGWSLAEFGDALQHGVSPKGQHYYPAFPYTAYALMRTQDIVDLKAFMDTLPADATPSPPHEVGFPFNIRRSLGGWKLLYARHGHATAEPDTPELTRGRYLSEALAHCGDCHTPRNALGGLDYAAWMGGAPNPTGRGRIPNITPAALDWAADDIAYYLETGFTPDFDSAGGHMAAVVSNMAQLPAKDRAAIAAYLKWLPPVAEPQAGTSAQ